MFGLSKKEKPAPGHRAKVAMKIDKVSYMVRKADGRLISPEQNQKEYKEAQKANSKG